MTAQEKYNARMKVRKARSKKSVQAVVLVIKMIKGDRLPSRPNANRGKNGRRKELFLGRE